MARKKAAPEVTTTTAEARTKIGNIPVFCTYDDLVPIAELKANPLNPNHHPKQQIDLLARIIAGQGWRVAVTVSKLSGYIVRGHGRVEAAKQLGLTVVPVEYQAYATIEEEYADLIADNKVAEFSKVDERELAVLIQEIADACDFDLSLTGYNEAELRVALNTLLETSPEETFSFDEAIEAVDEQRVQPGDIWQLGNHLLICGDSRDPEVFERLLRGDLAQVCVTSPPYGVGKEYEEKGIDAWFDTIRPVIANITRHSSIICWNIGDLFATGSQFIEPTSVYSINMFSEQGFRPIWIRIWKKQGSNFGVSPYHLVSNKPVQQYEYIAALANAVVSESQKSADDQAVVENDYQLVTAFAGHAARFVRRLTSEERRQWGYSGIWEMNTVPANKEHPAMFPVELPARCIKMHSDVGGLVLEPFCGAGTTIIACQQTGRSCRAVEWLPKYCAVSIKRWEDYTGQAAVLLSREAG